MDSDEELDRFLNDGDDESYSPDVKYRSNRPIDSSSSVLAAAAAALKSSHTIKSHASKNKKSKKSKKSKTSDMEEAPPSYTSAMDSNEYDPYAFEVDTASFQFATPDPMSPKKESSKKKKTKLKDVVQKEMKTSISIEDRVANILKRTGNATAIEKTEDSSSPKSESSGHNSDSGESSKGLDASDSLGINSADFEVGRKSKWQPVRESVTSATSENFSINVDALRESTDIPSRYASASVHQVKEEEEEEYEDDDFEMEQSLSQVRSDAEGETSPEPNDNFVSQFASMKTFFQVDEEQSAYTTDTNVKVDEEQPPSLSAAKLEDSEAFGYDEDEFEDEESQVVTSKAPPDDSNEDERSASPLVSEQPQDESIHSAKDDSGRDDAHEQEVSAQNASDAVYSADEDEKIDTQRSEDTYSYKQEIQEEQQEEPRVNTRPPSPIQPVAYTEATSKNSIPMSPPPPPPPDDDVQSSIKETTERNVTTREEERTSEPAPTSSYVSPAVQNQPPPIFSKPKQSPSYPNQHKVMEEEPLQDKEYTDDNLYAVDADIDGLVRASHQWKQRQVVAASNSLRESARREQELKLRLQQKQRQVDQLKTAMQVFQEGVTEDDDPILPSIPKHKQPKGTSTHPSIAPDLLKEMQTQEKLIEAYQKENERLMYQLKEAQDGMQSEAYLYNQDLKYQVRDLQCQLEANKNKASITSIPSTHDKSQYHAAVEARLTAEAKALALQEELDTMQATHRDRENELKVALDRVKKAKKDVEWKYEGVDVVKMEEDSHQMDALMSQMELMKQEHAHALASLQKKLDWYMENQRLVNAQDDELHQLRRRNEELEAQVTPPKRAMSGQKTTRGRASGRSPVDVRRIQELEKRLQQMEESWRTKHPDSVSNLIFASRRAEEDARADRIRDEYQTKVAELQEEMDAMHETNERKLRGFRQQQEKIVAQYQKRIQEQEKKLEHYIQHEKPKDTSACGKKHKEDQVKRIREFYIEKVKETERKWEVRYRALRKQLYSSKNDQHDSSMQRKLHERQKEIDRLKAQLEKVNRSDGTHKIEHEVDKHPSCISSSIPSPAKPLANELASKRISLLEKKLEASERERDKLTQTLEQVSSKEKMKGEKITSQLKALEAQMEKQSSYAREELQTLRAQFEAEKKAREEAESIAAAQTQSQQTLHSHLTSLESEKLQLEQNARRIPALEQEICRLHRERNVPRTPSMMQYRELEMKVETLVNKYAIREEELRHIVHQASQSGYLERLTLQKTHDNAMALKNAEIQKFKQQLDEIVNELEVLHTRTA